MDKITYLFGAGASCHALPILNEMPKRMENVLNRAFFNDVKHKKESELNSSGKKVFKVYTEINWLQKEAIKHQTVDTFAKKLSIRQDWNLLRRLKTALSMYFMIEQSIDDNPNEVIAENGKKRLDYRYDSFFASILGNSREDLPKNVNILSWNYDYQFEIAFAEYSQNNEIFLNQQYLNMRSKSGGSQDFEKFNIIKLNGTVGNRAVNQAEYDYIPTNFLDAKLKENIENLADWSDKMNSRSYQHDLSFAWEEDINSAESVVNRAIDACKDTSVLIVIGYSFPFFNREIDRKIINSMPQLRKVYFQDKNPKNIETRFKNTIRLYSSEPSLDELEFVSYNETSEFLLPSEL